MFDLPDFDSGIIREPILDLLFDLFGRYLPHRHIWLTERENLYLHFFFFWLRVFFAER